MSLAGLSPVLHRAVGRPRRVLRRVGARPVSGGARGQLRAGGCVVLREWGGAGRVRGGVPAQDEAPCRRNDENDCCHAHASARAAHRPGVSGLLRPDRLAAGRRHEHRHHRHARRRRRRPGVLRHVFHLSDAARPARGRAGPGDVGQHGRPGIDGPQEGPLNAELPGTAGCGIHARRRNRQHARPRALADARAVRRLGRVLPVRAGPVPARREPQGELRGRERQVREVHRDRRRDRRDRAARLLRDSGVGHAREERSRRKTRRSSSASSANSSRGTCTIRARRQVRPHRHQARDAPTIRSASIGPIRTPRTTSPPSTS